MCEVMKESKTIRAFVMQYHDGVVRHKDILIVYIKSARTEGAGA